MLPSRGRDCRLRGLRRCVGRCGERRGTATEGYVRLRHGRARRSDAGSSPTVGIEESHSGADFVAASRCADAGRTLGNVCPGLARAWTLQSRSRIARVCLFMRKLPCPALYSTRVPR